MFWTIWAGRFCSIGLRPFRIAVLGGPTTNEIVDLLEIFLLDTGFQPTFWQSEYGCFYEDAVLDPAGLIAFAPDVVHTSCLNVLEMPVRAFADVTLTLGECDTVSLYGFSLIGDPPRVVLLARKGPLRKPGVLTPQGVAELLAELGEPCRTPVLVAFTITGL